jgi:hypothetical protein
LARARQSVRSFPPGVAYWEYMVSVERVIAELKELTSDQLDLVAQIVRELASERSHTRPEPQYDARVPESIVAEAARNGWPADLFAEAIGRVDEDFSRPPQFPAEPRPSL